jgi:hypothetical protein
MGHAITFGNLNHRNTAGGDLHDAAITLFHVVCSRSGCRSAASQSTRDAGF